MTRSSNNPRRWTALAAAEIGAAHVKRQMPCQDACAIVVRRTGLVLGALSDGVGSASQSEVGARLAIASALKAMIEEARERTLRDAQPPPRDVFERALGRAVEAIRRCAVAAQREEGDYACTLILLAVAPTWIAALSVGDGFVAWRPADSPEHQVLLPPEKGEFVNYTTAITSMNASESVRFEIRQQPPAFAMASSDGLLYLALKSESWQPHAPFFQFLESQARRSDMSLELLRALLRHPQVAELSDDDKSLLIVSSRRYDAASARCDAPPNESGEGIDVPG